MINKWIRRHILWEYWFVLVLMILSIIGLIAYLIIPLLQIQFKSLQIYSNTLFFILLFIWLRFLKSKLNQGEK